jgi:hypothetical protein
MTEESGQISCSGKELFSSIQTGCGVQPVFYPMITGIYLPGEGGVKVA